MGKCFFQILPNMSRIASRRCVIGEGLWKLKPGAQGHRQTASASGWIDSEAPQASSTIGVVSYLGLRIPSHRWCQARS